MILVYCTTPDIRCAKKIASRLVRKRLAGCVSLQRRIISIYRWKGSIETTQEVLLTVKTIKSNYFKIQKEIQTMHPYEVPEILSVNVNRGLKRYLKWVADSCGNN